MAELTKEALVPYLTELSVKKAQEIAHEEFIKFEQEHPTDLVGPDIRDLILQRATSDLIMSLNRFHFSGLDLDKEKIGEQFDLWFAQNEEDDLRKVCASAGREALKKQSRPGDENLTFTDKFLRSVRENQKNPNVSSVIRNLDL